MKLPHLFFVNIKNFHPIHLIIRMDLEEVQSTTKSNIITIISDLLENEIKNIKQMKFIIREYSDDLTINRDVLSEYFKKYIYYDVNIKNWIIVNKEKPDYNILNVVNQDKIIKLILVGGEPSQKVLENYELRNTLFHSFERIYYKKPTDASIYSALNDYGEIDVETIGEILPENNNKQYAILLEDGLPLHTVEQFIKLAYKTHNITIYTKSKLDLYKIQYIDNEIIYKKVILR